MKRLLTAFVTLCMSLGLSGCLTTNEQGGALAGGVLGGIVGHQFGSGTGNVAATIAGTMLGAYAGSQWGKSIDEASRRKAMRAEQEAIYSGSARRWESDSYRGEVIPEPSYYEGHRKCRRYKSVIWIDEKPQKAYGRACMVDGQWKIVS